MVSAEDIILGSTVVGLERRINFLESIVINLAVSEDGFIGQYPIAIGPRSARFFQGTANGIDVGIRDGYILSSVAGIGRFTLRLTDAGTPIWNITGSVGSASAYGVARDRSGNVYATSSEQIQKWNSALVLQWTTLEWEIDSGPPPVMDSLSVRPSGCALTPDEQYIWVCDRDNVRMVKFATSSGAHVSEFDLDQGGNLNRPQYVAIDVNGFLYITDPNNNRIQKYNSAGIFQTKWGDSGTGDGQFSNLRGIAVATSRRSNNDVFVFAMDAATPSFPNARINVYAKAGGFRWDREIQTYDSTGSATGDVAIVWGAQTEWFYYPTEDQSDSVSAGTPDGGFAVPALNFYENQIIRSNIIGHMHIVIEILAAAFINAATGNTFNWTGSDNDNLYHVAVEAEEYDWLRPRKADLQGETIRPDEITEIELCLTKLEQSFPVTP